MEFWDFALSIGWWPIPVAALVGFSVGYVLRRSIWVLHVWPWWDTQTATTVGTGAGFLFGIIGVQIRPFLFDLSLSDLPEPTFGIVHDYSGRTIKRWLVSK
jgi:hypothetical protein